LKGLLKGGDKNKPLSYEEAREMARHANMNIRMELAVRSDVNPEIFYFLSEDPAAEVRGLIAGNEVTPAQADLVLAKDTDQVVERRLEKKSREGEKAKKSTAEESLAKAKELTEAGTLDEDSVRETVRNGNRDLDHGVAVTTFRPQDRGRPLGGFQPQRQGHARRRLESGPEHEFGGKAVKETGPGAAKGPAQGPGAGLSS
jgi:hypothetical protein